MAIAEITQAGERDKIVRLEASLRSLDLEAVRPLIQEIQELKLEKKAVVLAHNYQTPEVFHGVGDIRGDSLALAREAAASDAELIVVAGVHFMAETAAILNPERTVLVPTLTAGCSLAESISAEDVRALKAEHPGVPVVTYVNTSAEVKAESDVCCTSANAVEVVESLGAPRVLMLPDRHLANWVAANTSVEILSWSGACVVHEQLTASDAERCRKAMPGVMVLAHPECPLEVLEAADVVGSTSAMARHVMEKRPRRVALLTEASMADNLAVDLADVEIYRPHVVCEYMKEITLEGIRDSLRYDRYQVTVDPETAADARRAVERMLAVGHGRRG